jgi:hypothetical protein
LVKMLAMCLVTALVDRCRVSPIAVLDRPAAMAARTSVFR